MFLREACKPAELFFSPTFGIFFLKKTFEIQKHFSIVLFLAADAVFGKAERQLKALGDVTFLPDNRLELLSCN